MTETTVPYELRQNGPAFIDDLHRNYHHRGCRYHEHVKDLHDKLADEIDEDDEDKASPSKTDDTETASCEVILLTNDRGNLEKAQADGIAVFRG